MGILELRNRVLEYIHTADESVLQTIYAIFKNEEVAFWDELSAAEQHEIKEGIAQLEKGKRVSYETVLKKIS